MISAAALALLFVIQAGQSISGSATVIDGETLDFEGRRVALWAIDAPPLGQICSRDDEPYDCGAEAYDHLQYMVKDRPVRCRLGMGDGVRADVARCEVQWTQCFGYSCSQDWRDLNMEMVAEGLAIQRPTESAGAYDAEEEVARLGYAGIWSGPEWRGDRAAD